MKVLTVLLIIFIIFSFAGCGSNSAKFVRTDFGYANTPIMIMKSTKDISDYKDAIKQSSNNIFFHYISEKLDMLFCNYNQVYFEDSILFVAVIVESSGSIRHFVKNIKYDKDIMTVTVIKKIPNIGTCDMAEWHLLIEVSRKQFCGSQGNIVIELEKQTNYN